MHKYNNNYTNLAIASNTAITTRYSEMYNFR